MRGTLKSEKAMWTFGTRSGLCRLSGMLVGNGYSGHGNGVLNPELQGVHEVGPIPEGLWTIGEFFDDPGVKGPVVCHLTPAPDTNTFGRSGFMIHGDNSEADHTASEGCIILPRAVRNTIALSRDNQLMVIDDSSEAR